jgi:HEAT repeat protein
VNALSLLLLLVCGETDRGNSERLIFVEQAIQQLTRGDADERKAALEDLANLGSDSASALPALMQHLDRDIEVSEQRAVLLSIGKIGVRASSTAPRLHKILKDDSEDFSVRAMAARAMARIGPKGRIAIPTLIDLLNNPGPSEKQYRRKSSGIAPSADGYAALILRSDERGTYRDIRDLRINAFMAALTKAFQPVPEEELPVLREIASDPGQLGITRYFANKAVSKIEAQNAELTRPETPVVP